MKQPGFHLKEACYTRGDQKRKLDILSPSNTSSKLNDVKAELDQNVDYALSIEIWSKCC